MIDTAESTKWRVRGKVSVGRPKPKTLRGRPRVPFFPLPLPPVNPALYSRDDTDMLLARGGVRFRAHALPVLPSRVLAVHMPRDSVKTTRERCWATSRRDGASTGKIGIKEESHPFCKFTMLPAFDISSKCRFFMSIIKYYHLIQILIFYKYYTYFFI